MRRTIITLIFLFLIVFKNYGQTIAADSISKRVTQYLTALENIGFSGSVVVEVNGVPVVSKGYGYADREAEIKNSPSTVFDIGSLTKQFTASGILKLEMQGKLTTRDSLSKYFENLPDDKKQITIHDLLRHRSGLVSNVGGDYDSISETEFLKKVFSSALQFNVGTDFSYSNIGYSLLAMIIEKVSRQSYEMFLYENLWKPAEMEMTGYKRPPYTLNQIAVGYDDENKIWGKPTAKSWDKTSPYWHLKGNGGILSTSDDLYKWHKCLLTEKVLSKEAIHKLYYPKLRAEEKPTSYYAYGWDVSKTNRQTTQIWHDGTNHIFYADMLRYIDEKKTLILLSNQFHPHFNNLNFELSRIIFNPSFSPEMPAPDNTINRNFTLEIIRTIELQGLEKAKKQYKKRAGTEQLLEYYLRNSGFDYIDHAKPEIAIQIFEMNAFAYPHSAKALQGLAEGYMETGKKELAIKYFNESLRINSDNPFIVEMLKLMDK